MKSANGFLGICFLIALFQVYAIISALVFQQLERQAGDKNSRDEDIVVENVKIILKKSIRNESHTVLAELRRVFENDKKLEMRKRFQGIENSYLFSILSFTTLGNSGLQPTTWDSRLFYIFVIPIGFAIYVNIVLLFAYRFRDAIEYCIGRIENIEACNTKLLNLKIFFILMITSICVIQIGGINSVVNGRGFLYGIYASLDSLIFIGNENILRHDFSNKIYLSFLLSLYLMLIHSLVFNIICCCSPAWIELIDVITGAVTGPFCFRSGVSSQSTDYKEKLLASFDSSDTDTPPNEKETSDCVEFPQIWNVSSENYDIESKIKEGNVMRGLTERKNCHFIEIFKAQKFLFEPIIESSEGTPDESMSDSSSYKSTKDYFEKEGLLNDVERNEELSSGHSTPIDSDVSTSSSLSNINLQDGQG